MKPATLSLFFLSVALWAGAAQAQTKKAVRPAVKAAPAKTAPVKPAAAKPTDPATVITVPPVAKPTAVALITNSMEQAPPSTDAIKVRAEANPLTKRLTVRTDVTGPTRVEINDSEGRPVITRDLMTGNEATVLDVSSLPPGYYIVHCTAGTRSGMRRVLVGQ